jgi:hypothetical protein
VIFLHHIFQDSSEVYPRCLRVSPQSVGGKSAIACFAVGAMHPKLEYRGFHVVAFPPFLYGDISKLLTLTDHPENRISFKKPDNYNELEYELLFRNYEAAEGSIEEMYSYGDPLVPWINTPMPNRKTDTNNQKGFSTDFIEQNYDYPEESYEEREKFIECHRNYQQGLMWTLAYHPRIPKKVRDVVSRWGTCKDEYERDDG